MTLDEVKRFLRNARDRDRVAGAYVVHGGTAAERLDAAVFFAGVLQCEGEGEKPCGACPSCAAVGRRSHPDVVFVEPGEDESGRKRRLLGIDDIRDIKENLYLRPYSGRYKLYIFGEHPMREEAANAFLKMLEEPPAYGVLLIPRMTLNSLLPTIVSRCQCLRLDFRLPEATEESQTPAETCARLRSALQAGKIDEFFRGVDAVCKETDREAFELWMERLAWSWRNEVLAQQGIPADLLVKPAGRGTIEGAVGLDDLREAVEIRARNRFNINIRLALEHLIASSSRSGGTGRRARFRT